MIDRHPVGFTFTVVDEDESRTYTIASQLKPALRRTSGSKTSEFDYVMRDENRTTYLVRHDFVQACVELADEASDE